MTKAKGFTHDNIDNKSIEWYTPKWVFDKLGLQFDLDACAPEGGIPWIPAKKHYSIKDDGLTSSWGECLTWLNPPYGKFTAAWLNKMHKHRNGVALVFARTDCAWFHDSVATADAILFLKGRVKFVDGLGITGQNGAGCGSMLIAWGDISVNALRNMSELGYFIQRDTYYPLKDLI